MNEPLSTKYDPQAIQGPIYRRWLEAGAFAAVPDERSRRYVVMMPLPNVTGALHMGHAMDNVMQDLLVRWHRMQGDNTLWQPGTDHAGIATQAVVEKRLFEQEGKTRHDIGREALVGRIFAWKDQFQARIVSQQQQMGCSCDWERQRFTMDAVCSRAVREAFFRLFRDRLIYRGYRLVNWDCHLQTAVADDELEDRDTNGQLWHLRYPVLDRQPDEPEHVIVATTRPETMLGDTAVAVHPDPGPALEAAIERARARLADAAAKERAELEKALARLEARRASHLPVLEKLAAMAGAGRKVMLPLQERPIPLVTDAVLVDPALGSGCVKVTPAHDPNDYGVWQRQRGAIEIVNILCPDGTLNPQAGAYAGLERFAARKKVVADLKARGLLEKVEDWRLTIPYSDRSKTPVEPYLSKQWFVRMEDVPGGIACGAGTPCEHRAAGLAQAAIDAADATWRSPSGRRLEFHPDPDRYRNMYVSWLAVKKDWCISRQLWWGHRIPVWHGELRDAALLQAAVEALPVGGDVHAWVLDEAGRQLDPREALAAAQAQERVDPEGGTFELQVCLRTAALDAELGPRLEALGLTRDGDVLDTWFSSALWPFSTLGWPEPAGAAVEPGQRPLGPGEDGPDALSYYYPGSCLVTGRDILTLWVARMVILGLYALGDLPFTDVFLHAKIMDGKGETMSKSKGNGIDPVDIIERYGADAMRYLICDMQTGMQDVRLPVQAVCPGCQTKLELARTPHGKTLQGGENLFTYVCSSCQQEFDVLGTMPALPAATIFSDRFEDGQRFCNKLWNAARFALMNLGELSWRPLAPGELAPEDRWVLSRLARGIDEVDRALRAYQPSAAQSAARDLLWNEVCDWYLELIKPRLRDAARAPVARQVLAVALDQVLRLLHPFVPFISEALWERLTAQVQVRGLEHALPGSELLIRAAWPRAATFARDEALEAEFERFQAVIRGIRNVRKEYDVPPDRQLVAAVRADGAALAELSRYRDPIVSLAGLSALELGPDVARPRNAAAQVVGEVEVYVADVLDPARERARLTAQRDKLTRQLDGIEKKLGNAGFVAKAPPEVVQAEQARREELRAQVQRIDDNLAALG